MACISTTRHELINFVFMTPAEKFCAALKASPYTPADFARLMSVEPQDVQNWKIRGISLKQSFRAARLLGRDPEWLAFDDKDLDDNISTESKAEAVEARHLWELLTEGQRELVSRLILEIVAK